MKQRTNDRTYARLQFLPSRSLFHSWRFLLAVNNVLEAVLERLRSHSLRSRSVVHVIASGVAELLPGPGVMIEEVAGLITIVQRFRGSWQSVISSLRKGL